MVKICPHSGRDLLPANRRGLQTAVRINTAMQRLARTPERLLQLYSENQQAAYETSLRDFFSAHIKASPDY